jgi:hypothetical protein
VHILDQCRHRRPNCASKIEAMLMFFRILSCYSSSFNLSPNSQLNLSYMHGGPESEGSIDPNETPEERERREKDRRAANNARERYSSRIVSVIHRIQRMLAFDVDYVYETSTMHSKNSDECVPFICVMINL